MIIRKMMMMSVLINLHHFHHKHNFHHYPSPHQDYENETLQRKVEADNQVATEVIIMYHTASAAPIIMYHLTTMCQMYQMISN